ncbi:MAG: fibrinogen-like YCDxxxxGGGW domain-containing protein [Nannocystaceae bacterium]
MGVWKQQNWARVACGVFAAAAVLSGCGDDGVGTSAGESDSEATTGEATTSGEATTTTTGEATTTSGASASDSEASSTSTTTGETTGETSGGGACGDGVVDEGEACDDGNADNSDLCLDTCEVASCGDGYVGPGESCDDGNQVDDDACSNSCALASCGDGVVQEGEACDDGNDVDTDGCLNTCVLASCGDGVVQEGAEVCDDGNDVETDACLGTCVAASCGDGVVQEGVEACDDGNDVDADDCTTQCLAPTCDDGLLSGDESDVDCGGSCEATCADGAMCAGGGDCGSGFCLDGACAVAASCKVIKDADVDASDGVYTIDPDGDGPAAARTVYCDMTTDGGGWTMVFKVSSGVAGNANALWNGPALNDDDEALLDLAIADKHYVSGIIGQQWNSGGFTLAEVRAGTYVGGALKKHFAFDGVGTNKTSWFASAKLTGSGYLDVANGPWNFFSIAGDNNYGRNWFVSRNYGGCGNDSGWLIVDTTNDACTWESGAGAPLRILYSASNTYTNWNTANNVAKAEVFAVFIR